VVRDTYKKQIFSIAVHEKRRTKTSPPDTGE